MRVYTDNPYGYKICRVKKKGKSKNTLFKAYTYNQAVKMKRLILRNTRLYPKEKYETWHIIPISKSEVRSGIWREDPF